jgi:hypothetical protein
MEELGNLGDFVGGIAVVVTLIYLAIQVRQNTLALKASSWQEVVAGTRQAARLRGSPEMARAFAVGLASYPDMDDGNRARFSTQVTDEALNFQSIYALYQSKQLAEPVYNAYLVWFAAIIATPGGTAWWEVIGRPIFVPDMVAAIDRRLAAGGLPDIRAMPGYDVPR